MNDPNRSAFAVLIDAAKFAMGGFAYKALALFTLPILARLLSPAELGVLDFAALVGTIVSVVVGAGSDNALARHDRTHGGIWGAAMSVVLVGGASLTAVALVAAPLGISLVDGAAPALLPLAIGYGAALAVMSLGLNAVRLGPGSATYFKYSLGILACQTAVALALAAWVPDPIPWILLAWLIISGVAGTGMLWRYQRRAFSLGKQGLGPLLAFGLPLVPATLTWLIGDAVIRNGIAQFVGVGDLGAYSVGHRVANVLPLLATGFGLAWYPFLYRTDEQRRSSAVPVITIAMIGLLGATSLVLGLLAREIVLILGGAEYLDGAAAIGPLAVGFVGYGLLTLLAGVAGIEMKTVRIALASAIGLATQVTAAAVLIPADGLRGGAVAAMLGFGAALAVMAPHMRTLVLGPRHTLAIVGILATIISASFWGSINVAGDLMVRVTVLLGSLAVVLALSAFAIVTPHGGAAAHED